MKVGDKEKKRAACFDIKVAWLAIARMYNAEATPSDITTNTGFVLLHIEDQGTPATKIAPLLGMETRSLTRMLTRMEEQGLIYRQPDKLDRRMVRIFLTELGHEKKAIAKDLVIRFNKDLRAHIPKRKMDTFFEVLDSINQVVSQRNNQYRAAQRNQVQKSNKEITIRS